MVQLLWKTVWQFLKVFTMPFHISNWSICGFWYLQGVLEPILHGYGGMTVYFSKAVSTLPSKCCKPLHSHHPGTSLVTSHLRTTAASPARSQPCSPLHLSSSEHPLCPLGSLQNLQDPLIPMLGHLYLVLLPPPADLGLSGSLPALRWHSSSLKMTLLE